MPLTQDELQTVINLVDARLERQYNEEYQTILGTKYFSTCLENFKQKKYTIFQQQQY